MRLRGNTCVVRFQYPLEGLAVVISTQTKLFVDVTGFQKQFGIFFVCRRWFIQLSMESIKSSIFQDTYFTLDQKEYKSVTMSLKNSVLSIHNILF